MHLLSHIHSWKIIFPLSLKLVVCTEKNVERKGELKVLDVRSKGSHNHYKFRSGEVWWQWIGVVIPHFEFLILWNEASWIGHVFICSYNFIHPYNMTNLEAEKWGRPIDSIEAQVGLLLYLSTWVMWLCDITSLHESCTHMRCRVCNTPWEYAILCGTLVIVVMCKLILPFKLAVDLIGQQDAWAV